MLASVVSKRNIISLFFVLTGLLAGVTGRIHALQTAQPSFAQHDLDGDKAPDLVIIDFPFATENDQILVYAQDNGMSWGERLDDILRFYEETWIFDVGRDGTAQLIIDFRKENNKLSASIFDDYDGDGVVAYNLEDQTVVITESQNWHVQVVTESSWTLPDGSINPELIYYVDGTILRYLDWGEAYPAQSYALEHAITDGTVDWEIEIVDNDMNGIPDYQLQRLMTWFPQYYAVFRATLYSNPHQNRALHYPNYIIWPLLVSSHNYEAYNYFDRPPVVAINWEQAKIDRAGIIGYPIENGYHINSRFSWEKGQENYADFENPMAYYDLANDKDGRPELFVRFEVFEKGDPLVLVRFNGQKAPVPLTHVEYTWDSNNDGRWDYEMGLGARFPINSTVEYADFSIRTVPYELIPTWVNGQHWDMAIFFAAENGGYWNSEGMGEWGINRGYLGGELVEPSDLRDLYLTGMAGATSLEAFTRYYNEIPVGFRGELAAHYFSEPQLYVSPIDGRVHLYRATQGVWSISDQKVIRTQDLNADGFIDQWQLFTGEEIDSALNVAQNFLLYAGEGEVVIKSLSSIPEVKLFQPPVNNDKRIAINELAQNYPIDASNRFLKSLLDKLDGKETRLVGVSMSSLRPTAGGFRLQLTLKPDFRLTGPDLLSLSGLAPGEYVVEYRNGMFSVITLTPPQLTLAARQPDLSKPIQLTIGNAGTADSPGLTLVTEALLPDGAIVELARKPMDVLAGEDALVLIDIPTTIAGRGDLRARLEDGKGEIVAELVPMPLAGAPPADSAAIARLGNEPVLIPVILLFAFALGFAAYMATGRYRNPAS